jgi:hypothetical protein
MESRLAEGRSFLIMAWPRAFPQVTIGGNAKSGSRDGDGNDEGNYDNFVRRNISSHLISSQLSSSGLFTLAPSSASTLVSQDDPLTSHQHISLRK